MEPPKPTTVKSRKLLVKNDKPSIEITEEELDKYTVCCGKTSYLSDWYSKVEEAPMLIHPEPTTFSLVFQMSLSRQIVP